MLNSPEAFGFFGIWSGGGTVPPDSLYETPTSPASVESTWVAACKTIRSTPWSTT